MVDSSSNRLLRVIYIYYDDNEFLVDDLLIGIAIYKELMTPYGQHGVYYAVFSSLKTVRDYRETRGKRAVTVAREFIFLLLYVFFFFFFFVCALLSWSTIVGWQFFFHFCTREFVKSLIFFFLFKKKKLRFFSLNPIFSFMRKTLYVDEIDEVCLAL